MTHRSTTPRRVLLLGAAAIAGALPATALAKHGADDGASTTTQTTISTTTGSTTTGSTTTGTSTTPAPAVSGQRARAVAAAKAAVRERTTVLRVKRKSNVRWEVRLAGARTRYTVRLDRDLDVTRVRREVLRPAGGSSDDGTPDQASGDAPGTSTGTAPSGSSSGSGHHSGSDDSGHQGGRGSDDD